MAAVRRVNNVLDPEHENTYVSELREESGEVGLLQYYRFSYSRIL